MSNNYVIRAMQAEELNPRPEEKKRRYWLYALIAGLVLVPVFVVVVAIGAFLLLRGSITPTYPNAQYPAPPAMAGSPQMAGPGMPGGMTAGMPGTMQGAIPGAIPGATSGAMAQQPGQMGPAGYPQPGSQPSPGWSPYPQPGNPGTPGMIRQPGTVPPGTGQDIYWDPVPDLPKYFEE